MSGTDNLAYRITNPKGARLFLAVAFLQAIVIISLEAAVLFKNMQQWEPIAGTATTTDLADGTLVGRAWLRFLRIRWENVAFMLFQIWVVWLSVDGVLDQNVVEIVAIAIINALCTVAAVIQISDNAKWIGMFGSSPRVSYNDLLTAQKVEIALTVMIILFAVVFAYLSYRLSGELMWKVFKKLGADDKRRFGFSHHTSNALFAHGNSHVPQLSTISSLSQSRRVLRIRHLALLSRTKVSCSSVGPEPRPYRMRDYPIVASVMVGEGCGRVSLEKRWMMWIFTCFQLIVVGHFILILWDTLERGDRWYSWIFMGEWIMLHVILVALGSGFGHRRRGPPA
ncbi:hypothetical protein BC936DRAFT_138298 [Jimgerdemannia flammicorona]|uniref:Uncharacterized protein n=1 Tax=Jimgerdemannia flammicorona TaxID=994334 RepID=A0A433CSR9_9FUNG|nr:hypothetical protein BC936DRAFT_138298 [Jimgerdemannia flammicorona]